MIVVDTNVLEYTYLSGDYAAAADALLEQQPKWGAPILWRSEFRNILAGYVRHGDSRITRSRFLPADAPHIP
jgi:hypothetical protein